MTEKLSCLAVIFTAVFFAEFVVALVGGNTGLALWRAACLIPVLFILASARREVDNKKNIALSEEGIRQLRKIRRRYKLESMDQAFELALRSQLGLDEVRSRSGIIVIRDEKIFKETRFRSDEITPEAVAEFFGEEDFMKGDDKPGDLEV